MSDHATWNTRELRILRAVRAAEEVGDDVDTAARDAVPDLATDLYNETIKALCDAGFLDAAVQPAGAGKLLVHVRRISPRGREVVGQWPVAPSIANVAQRMRRRLLFMDVLYDVVGDNTLASANVEDLATSLGWTERDADVVVEFLRAQGLIEALMGNEVSLTNAGIVEVERSRVEPDKPTEHFPPPSSVYIGGDAHSVQISLGSPGSAQQLEVTESNLTVATDFVAEFRRVFEDMPLGSDERVKAEVSLVAAEALLAAPDHDRRVLGAVLGALRDVALGVAGNAAFYGLVALAGRMT